VFFVMGDIPANPYFNKTSKTTVHIYLQNSPVKWQLKYPSWRSKTINLANDIIFS
jgi:hypothetical protein